MRIDPYASGVLYPEVHDRLVADITNAARDANIPARWVWTPLPVVCEPDEAEWVRRFHFHSADGWAGLCLCGPSTKIDPETRMAAITGALTRNFVLARVTTVNELVTAVHDGNVPLMSCLLVANFFVERGQVGTKGQWRSAALLVARHTAGLQTVLYVASLADMGLDYGAAMKRHVERLYRLVEVV